jgi:predicted nuclease of predicted toxin-antitoxin system
VTVEEPRRFYLDEDVPGSAAVIGRSLGLDVVAAPEVGPDGLEDVEHLDTAASQGRIMVTYNRDDFLDLTFAAFAAGKPHFGLIIFTRRLPRDGARLAHALERWCREKPPLQAYGYDFVSIY